MRKRLTYILKPFSKISIVSLLILASSCSNKEKEFKDVFGQKYIDAENYIDNNKWIKDSLARYGVDPNLAISIVFPELIRYSAIKDMIETHSLEVLYTQYGSEYADFSVGRFQMKPSFVNRLENDWNLLLNNLPLKCIIKPFNPIDNPEVRKQRIIRLNDEKWQVKYLSMFLEIIQHKYKMDWNNPEHIVSFLASAYNSGYWNDSVTIERMGKRNFFYTGLIRHNEVYNYSEISKYYYKKKCRK